MSEFVGRWTSTQKIKAHLQVSEVDPPSVFDEPVLLDSLSPGQLKHQNITDGSEVVKLRGTDIPVYTTKILVGTIAQLLAPFVVPGYKGSVFAGSDAMMTISYVENKDFVVNYAAGTIKRASVGSAIASGSTVHIWYIPYTVMVKNIDYAIDYDNGQIVRIAGTAIPDYATVAVDYAHSGSTITDAMIEEAIIEAEDFMVDRMSSPEATADAGLTTAATYYALAVIALSQASKELRTRSSDANDLSKEWLNIKNAYLERASMTFKKYAKTIDLSMGGSVISNRYSKGRSLSRTLPSISVASRGR